METNNINFVEAKMAFIREFMNSTRPASELEDFIKAFDTCKPDPLDDKIAPSCMQQENFPLVDPVVEEPAVRLQKRIKSKKRMVIHNETTAGVHPRAKMVSVKFMDRESYYGSITAAANGLHVSQAQVKYAIKHKKLLNGHEVSFKDTDTIFNNSNTK